MKKLLHYPLFYCVVGMAAAFNSSVRHDFEWGIGVLGGLICLYGWINRGEKNEKRHETGDNCYFIGFVYTLIVIALALALNASDIVANTNESKNIGGLQSLLETVGIALGTSVVGMLWRFGLTHGVVIPQDQIAQLINDTALAANKMEAAVTRISESAKRADESLREVDGAMTIYANSMRNEADRIGVHMTEVAGKLLTDFGNRITDTLQNTQFNHVRNELQETLEEHRKAVAEIGALLKKSIVMLDDTAHNTVGNFRASAKSIEAILQEIQDNTGGDKWRVIAEGINNFAATTEKMSKGLNQISEQQKILIVNTTRDAARLREMHGSFDSLIKDMHNDLATVANIKEEYRKEFKNAATTALQETHALYAKLIKGAEVAMSTLEDSGALSRDLQKVAQQLEKISSQLNK